MKTRGPIFSQAKRELTGEDADLKAWLTKPNTAFGRKTPLAVIVSGESDLLWEMIYQMRQGSFA